MDIATILSKGIFYTEGLALICSLIFIKKYIQTPSKLLPFYLVIVFGIEFIALKLAFDQWMYNALGIVELLIFSYIFYFSVREKHSKTIITLALLISVFALILDSIFFTKSFLIFLSNAFGFVSLCITIMCFVFLIELAKTEKVIHQSRILLYWVVIGLLFFHLFNLPVTVITNDLFEIGNVENILIIQSIAAIAMYSCFTIGFVWSRKEYNF